MSRHALLISQFVILAVIALPTVILPDLTPLPILFYDPDPSDPKNPPGLYFAYPDMVVPAANTSSDGQQLGSSVVDTGNDVFTEELGWDSPENLRKVRGEALALSAVISNRSILGPAPGSMVPLPPGR